MSKRILIRRDSEQNWINAGYPILNAGEFGYDTTLKLIKIGDGATRWNELPSIAMKGELDLSSYVTETELVDVIDGYSTTSHNHAGIYVTAFTNEQLTTNNSGIQTLTSTPNVCASQTLTVGVWDVVGIITIAPNASYVGTSSAYGGIQVDGVGGGVGAIGTERCYFGLGTTNIAGPSCMCIKRVSVTSGTKTVTTFGQASFSAGNVTWYGGITATRIS